MNWTEGRIKSFITSTIRSGFRRWPEKFEVLKEAFVRKGINPKTGRSAALYRCSTCNGEFSSKDIQVDHIEPVVDPIEGFKTWDEFISRLFCSKENLQVLCKECHLKKTKQEKDVRKRKGI
jgi:5-methylcytosine-specific restriction endonuclease McrA